jgi:N-glycosylase/DNA lyase
LIGERPVYVEDRPGGLRTRRADAALVRDYFAVDHDLAAIHASFPDDEPMRKALEYCGGMRILRQPEWECTATFITSSMKQVAHIRQMSLALRRKYGKAVQGATGEPAYAYPTPESLARAGESELRQCGLGYRAKTLAGAAKAVADGVVDLGAIRGLPDEAARDELMRLPGVGEKVANCVLLFAYGRLGAFPVDTWIERILREKYLSRRRKITPAVMRTFARDYFGPHGGYAQQYLFHHARSSKRASTSRASA